MDPNELARLPVAAGRVACRLERELGGAAPYPAGDTGLEPRQPLAQHVIVEGAPLERTVVSTRYHPPIARARAAR